MTSYFDQVVGDDFVWKAISESIYSRRRRVGGNFINLNCPMCVHRGHRADRRGRCGVKRNPSGCGGNCFNCNFKFIWTTGSLISDDLALFMREIGIPDIEVKRIAHKALKYRRLIEASPDVAALIPGFISLDFKPRELPRGAATIGTWLSRDCQDQDFLDTLDYLVSRGEDVSQATEYYWTPHSPDRHANLNRRVIIPFKKGGDIVGWTGRAIDDVSRGKYHSDVPEHYIFNNHVMDLRNRKFIIGVEGVFCALAIDGCATLGAKMTAQQVNWMNSTEKTKIIVPDRDGKSGPLIEIAMKNNWHVAFPATRSGRDNWWADYVVENGQKVFVKDVATAVKHYGRLYVLASIMKTATSNHNEIMMKAKLLG